MYTNRAHETNSNAIPAPLSAASSSRLAARSLVSRKVAPTSLRTLGTVGLQGRSPTTFDPSYQTCEIHVKSI
jgi:hypothetical protein